MNLDEHKKAEIASSTQIYLNGALTEAKGDGQDCIDILLGVLAMEIALHKKPDRSVAEVAKDIAEDLTTRIDLSVTALEIAHGTD